jgi:thymidylate synthase
MFNFSNDYCSIISRIMHMGIEEANTRTGMKTKSLPGITIQVDLAKEFPLLTARSIRVENFVAEMMWFLSGNTNTNVFLNKHTKIWDSFTDDEGYVETAYGYRWRNFFGRDQIDALVNLLQADKSSRHGVIITWDPATDGLGGTPKKNVPCPYTFTVNIIGGRLHLHNIIRSNDMILGCPTDVAGFSFLALILAQKLGVEPGIYTHSISNAHIYENHYEAANELRRRYVNEPIPTVPTIKLPDNAFDLSCTLNEEFFTETVAKFKQVYKPMEPIKGLVISL